MNKPENKDIENKNLKSVDLIAEKQKLYDEIIAQRKQELEDLQEDWYIEDYDDDCFDDNVTDLELELDAMIEWKRQEESSSDLEEKLSPDNMNSTEYGPDAPSYEEGDYFID